MDRWSLLCAVARLALAPEAAAISTFSAPQIGPAPEDVPDSRSPVQELGLQLSSMRGPDEDPHGICYADPMTQAVLAHHDELYKRKLDGQRYAGELRVLFTGLLRNAAPAVRRSYKLLVAMARRFKDYRIMVYENDSEDDTAALLAEFHKLDDRFLFKSEKLSTKYLRQLENERFHRMAQVRNKLHRWVKDFADHGHWDLVVVFDFDLGLFGRHAVTADMFWAALGRPATRAHEWDMLCANSLRHYADKPQEPVGHHDCFAFRTEGHDGFNAPACWETIARTLYDGQDLVPVHSCFGGLAIYNSTAYSGCTYDEAADDCEHVSFHKCMREQGSEGRMFMDPMMTTVYTLNIGHTCYHQGGPVRAAPSAVEPALQPSAA